MGSKLFVKRALEGTHGGPFPHSHSPRPDILCHGLYTPLTPQLELGLRQPQTLFLQPKTPPNTQFPSPTPDALRPVVLNLRGVNNFQGSAGPWGKQEFLQLLGGRLIIKLTGA